VGLGVDLWFLANFQQNPQLCWKNPGDRQLERFRPNTMNLACSGSQLARPQLVVCFTRRWQLSSQSQTVSLDMAWLFGNITGTWRIWMVDFPLANPVGLDFFLCEGHFKEIQYNVNCGCIIIMHIFLRIIVQAVAGKVHPCTSILVAHHHFLGVSLRPWINQGRSSSGFEINSSKFDGWGTNISLQTWYLFRARRLLQTCLPCKDLKCHHAKPIPLDTQGFWGPICKEHGYERYERKNQIILKCYSRERLSAGFFQ
jgi:hypothetical protein